MCINNFTSYFSRLKVNTFDCKAIERETRGQSNNNDWHIAGLGWLTASNFGTICKRKVNTPPECFVKTLMKYDVEDYDGPSVCWGRSHERAARRTYESYQKKKHENFACNESGLCVNEHYPHLGASPDGLVSCKCCGEGLLEIKCPFTWRFTSPLEVSNDPLFSCSIEDGKQMLKRRHAYHFQVQGQMAICQKKYCDFCVWTLKGF
ncbi:hypothetical protein SNE40_002778 [Patella caerulea]|uniref:YqaJ viral recombinase domain-containing protein n=1 Tax=Patella caerulea TaxID=87958 RepID=A0AAN8PZM0_PATCE